MKSRSTKILLRDKITGELAEAFLFDSIDEEHIRGVETHWRPALSLGLERLAASGKSQREWPQSRHWDWRKKVSHVRNILAYRGFAIVCRDQVQGLMLVTTAEVCRLPENRGKPLVYIDYLETAPWNQHALMELPRFGGIGTHMLAAAIDLSREEGFFGRIGLHSLPQSEAFYDAWGMSRLGIDPSKQGLIYFEMDTKQATAFMET